MLVDTVCEVTEVWSVYQQHPESLKTPVLVILTLIGGVYLIIITMLGLL